jgi:predicted RNA binding protein YcfA (HicA-like mRNA interferase family)
MSRKNKILERILSGTSDANIDFDDMRNLLNKLEFDERIKGSHHIFTKNNITEILNLQSKSGKAKPYQVKQVRNLILKYKLGVANVK